MAIAFQPTPGTTVAVTTSTTSARAAIKGDPVSPNTRMQFLVSNEGTTTAFVRFGDSTVTATETDTPVLGGRQQVFSVSTPDGVTDGVYVAAIAASGTGKVYATAGVGIR